MLAGICNSLQKAHALHPFSLLCYRIFEYLGAISQQKGQNVFIFVFMFIMLSCIVSLQMMQKLEEQKKTYEELSVKLEEVLGRSWTVC
jgi:hypothetical protein